MQERTLEQRLRRQAARLDLKVWKSRSDGTYSVSDVWTNCHVAPNLTSAKGTGGFDLEELQDFLEAESGTD